MLRYNRSTGAFFWRAPVKQRPNRTNVRAGGLNGVEGYWKIVLDGKRYYAHRLAWLYVYGRFPSGGLDHKNRNKSDNRIKNLREATTGQNLTNSKTRSSHSGLKGAYWNSRKNKWEGAVNYGGKKNHLGYFPTAEDAHAAYCKAAKKRYGAFFNSGEAR